MIVVWYPPTAVKVLVNDPTTISRPVPSNARPMQVEVPLEVPMASPWTRPTADAVEAPDAEPTALAMEELSARAEEVPDDVPIELN